MIELAIGFVFHLDQYHESIMKTFGFWSDLTLFLVIFMGTGLAATSFLPGESLLFGAGASSNASE